MSQFIFHRQVECNVLKNMKEQVIKLTRGEPLLFLSTLNYHEMITARINLDMRA
jgi:hypothetical protein